MIRVYHELDDRRVLLVSPENSALSAWDFHCHTAENDSGTLYLTILKSNPEYYYIHRLASELVVEIEGVEQWRGRVLSDQDALKGTVQITAKGCLDYFRDSVMESVELSGEPEAVLAQVVALHNSKPLGDRKKFVLGTVTVQQKIEGLKATNGDKTWMILKRMVSACGGKFLIRRENGVNYIDWLSEYTHVCSQGIRLGLNLIDAVRAASFDELATVLYLYGKSVDGAEITVANVNDGAVYIKNDDAVDLFGWIEDKYRNSNVDDPAELLALGHADLSRRLNTGISVKISASDISPNVSTECIEVGMIVNAELTDQSISLPCTEIDRYYLDPKKTKITLGTSFKAISAMIGGNL